MSSEVLTSWKEIASFLGKGVRTVQRWEAQLGLPVHRPNLGAKGKVEASKEELQTWMSTRWSPRSEALVQVPVLHPQTHVTTDTIGRSRKMREQRQQVLDEFRAARERLLSELQTSVEVVFRSQTAALHDQNR